MVMRAHLNRFTKGGGVGVLIGVGLWIQQGGLSTPTPTPPLYWLGVALMVIGAGLGIYGWFGKPYKESKLLDEIKALLVEIDACERNAAIKKGKQKCPRKAIEQITKDAVEIYGNLFSFITSMVDNVLGEGNIDYLIGFFAQFGDIMDAEDCGLKSELSETETYSKLNTDLAKKRANLEGRKRERDIVEKNIDRVRALTYGVNSSRVFREVLKSIPEARNLPRYIMVRLESMEAAMQRLLPKMLRTLDSEWKKMEVNIDGM